MAFVRNNNNNRRHNNNYNGNRHRHQNSNPNQNNNGQRRHVNRVNQVFESNGPDGRIRGTAQQIVEKYATLARDAAISGDKVLSLNYLQHGEHYQRLLNEITEENAVFEREREAQRQQNQQQPEVTASDAAEGFVNPEQLHQAINDVEGGEQPVQQQQSREQRPPRQHDRSERSERAPRPQRAPRPPMDDEIDDNDNQLPGFLQVPIKQGKPEMKPAPKAAEASAKQPATPEAAVEAAPAPRVRAAARPRRVAPAADDAAE